MKFIRRASFVLLFLLLVVGIVGWVTVRSVWFAEQIRTKIVSELERATGGHAELEGFRFDPRTWLVSVDGLTLHGTEGAGEPPLLHVKSVSVGWKLISLMDKKINVTSIDADTPEVYLHRNAQGVWNLPRTEKKSTVTPFERFVDLKAERVRVTKGLVRFEDQRIPLAFEAHDAEVSVAADSGPSYLGSVKSSRVHVTEPFRTPIDAGVESDVRMDHDGLSFKEAQVAFGGSHIRAAGRMLGWDKPRLEATAEGTVRVADLKRPLNLPMAPRGEATFNSTWAVSEASISGSGTLKAGGVDWAVAGVRLNPITLDADWRVTKREAFIDRAVVGLLGGQFRGTGKVTDWRDFSVDGKVAGLALTRLYSLQDSRPFPWSGTVAGDVRAEGRFPQLLSATSDLIVTRAEGGIPVDGQITFDYDVPGKKLVFSPSRVELAHSRADFSGDASRQLRVSASTSDLDELIPAVRFFAGRELTIPVKLDGSQLKAEGIVTNQNEFAGTVDVGRFEINDPAYSGTLDSLHAAVAANRTGLRADNFRLQQRGATVEGSLRTGWRDGNISDGDAIAGNLQLLSVDVARTLSELKVANLPPEAKLAGLLNATVQVSGTVGAPSISAEVRLANGSAWGQPLDRLRATLRASRTRLDIESAEGASGRANARLKGDYTPSGGDWRSGRLRFEVSGSEASVRRWMETIPEGVEFGVRGDAKGEVEVSGAKATLISLAGNVAIPQVTLNGRPLGDANIEASSRGRVMSAQVSARMLGSQVKGSAEWSLAGSNPGLGQMQVTGLTLENMRTLGLFGDPTRPLGARGSLDAEFGFSGPALRPDQWRATAKITRLLIEPRSTDTAIDTSRFALHNAAPLTGTFDSSGIKIDAARLVGEGTDLSIGGAIGIHSRTPWNLTLKGSFNLNGLSVFEPDLEASGVSMLDATVRGELYRPSINGSMELSAASFRLRNVPNGLDEVSGVVRFDTNRAVIEKFSAQTGGGLLNVTGFVGFGGPQLVYRLQSDAKHVRVRYPAEVSTTFDGRLSLSGTSAQSLLSGDVTVSRISLQAQADLVGLLASTARSAQSTPTQNALLRGMQLDVHVVTSADAELQTSLTRDLQPTADLRVRGTAARPVALGRLTVSEGELEIFGSRYRVNRGEVTLANPARIEPVLNFDVETVVRGVTVNINLNGPIDKLNSSYRSDPPLQPNEIITLLAFGRGPTGANATQQTAVTQAPGQQSAGGGSLLSGAILSPVNGRLQRLFGISRINLEPDLNTNSPQARLTIEQQVSREIRLTYITTLNRTQNQVVRFQWDFSQDYSLIAVRDESGLFGVDFQFRKRFK